MSRTDHRGLRAALVTVAVLGVTVSLAGCGTGHPASRSPEVTVGSTVGSAAGPTTGATPGAPTDTPSGSGTAVTPALVPIRQDDLDELGAALSDGTALTTEVENDMAQDSTE